MNTAENFIESTQKVLDCLLQNRDLLDERKRKVIKRIFRMLNCRRRVGEFIQFIREELFHLLPMERATNQCIRSIPHLEASLRELQGRLPNPHEDSNGDIIGDDIDHVKARMQDCLKNLRPRSAQTVEASPAQELSDDERIMNLLDEIRSRRTTEFTPPVRGSRNGPVSYGRKREQQKRKENYLKGERSKRQFPDNPNNPEAPPEPDNTL